MILAEMNLLGEKVPIDKEMERLRLLREKRKLNRAHH